MDTVPPTLREQQEEMERQSLIVAKHRAYKENSETADRQEWSTSKVGNTLTTCISTAFVDSVTEYMKPVTTRGRRVRAAAALRKSGLEPETIAYLFVRGLINILPKLCSSGMKYIKISSLTILALRPVHQEWRLKTFASTPFRKNLLKKLLKDMDKRSYPAHWKRRTLKNYFDAAELEWEGWSVREKQQIGYALLCLLRDTIGLVHFSTSSTFVTLDPEFLKKIEKMKDNSVLSYTLYQPMICVPKPWHETRNLFRGGYFTKNINPYCLVKGAKSRDVERLTMSHIKSTISAINGLQETSWRINKQMTDMLDWAYHNCPDKVGLPKDDAEPIPQRPEGYGENDTITKEHNKKCFLIYDNNRQMITKRISIEHTLTIARKYSKYKAIYFPHNLDSRGRTYPLPAFLSPQGPDWSRALLEFSEGSPIMDKKAEDWLAIHVANAWGNDKVSLADRIEWVHDNSDWVIACAAAPKDTLGWLEADKPFQFLRSCIEWRYYKATGIGFVSHLPIAVDATNSGLQHYSALLKDKVGGKAVNLIPGLPRQDIYGEVATTVEAWLEENLELDGDAFAWSDDWLRFGIDRKMTKRQVMVVPYAGKFSSCTRYTEQAYKDKLEEGHARLWPEEEDFDRLLFLSRIIWGSISEVVVKGREAMQWLSRLGSAWTDWANSQDDLVGYDKRMTWNTPDGFEVVQWRDNSVRARTNTYLNGRVRLSYFEEGAKLSKRGMSLSISPNFIHSLDACHMRMSINRALKLNITSFAMIHDSFGVHASKMEEFLEQCVKTSFVEMYGEGAKNPLVSMREALPFEYSDIPESGELDINGVLSSEFFFS